MKYIKLPIRKSLSILIKLLDSDEYFIQRNSTCVNISSIRYLKSLLSPHMTLRDLIKCLQKSGLETLFTKKALIISTPKAPASIVLNKILDEIEKKQEQIKNYIIKVNENLKAALAGNAMLKKMLEFSILHEKALLSLLPK